jgi:hypothetical protein
MSEYNNPRPLPNASASDPCTIVDNAISFDKVLNGNSTVTTYTGKQILSLSQAIDKFGFGVAPFTFAQGGTLESKNLLVSNDPVDSFLYKYVGSGSAPIVVPVGTNPIGNPNWQPFTATEAESINKRGGGSVQDFIDDYDGFTDALLAEAGIVDDGQPDKLGASQRVNGINTLISRNQKIKFNSVQDMKLLVAASGLSITLSDGDIVSTGLTDWRVVPSSVSGGFLVGGFKVIPLNGAWIADWKIDLTGVVSADTELSDAASLNGTIMLSSGKMRLDTKQTVGTNVKIHGFGPECVIDAQMTDVVFEFPRETGRSVKVWRGFHLISTGNTMANGVAFLLPGSQIGGALQYTSGYKFEDIEIGGGGQFGCGWDVSDTFRLTIRDCGYSFVTVPVRIYGSVVQCTIDNLTGNNDSYSRLYKGKNVGVSMSSRNDYIDAVTRVPENVKVLNSAFVTHLQGIGSLGLSVTCQNCDLDYIRDVGWGFGGGDGHRLIGGYIASSSQNFQFVGVLVDGAQTLDQVEIDGVTINSYASVASKQTAVQVGSGDAAPYTETAGVSVTNIKVIGPASSWDFGVQADRNKSVEISSNRFASGVIKPGGKAINASNQKNLTCNSNKCSGQEIYITAPDATATITAVDNNATVVTAFMAPPASNIEIARNRSSVV